jgi:4'-phosphopantetheinyl transferase
MFSANPACYMERMSLTFERMVFEQNSQGASPRTIEADDVHVYGFLLEIGSAECLTASGLLSYEERTRAERLVSQLHRDQFVVAHAGLRVILSRYCTGRPHALAIQKTAKGKPFLPEYPSIRFNLTHSHGRALIAVGKDQEVGVDLEKTRPEVDVISLARRFLSDRDVAFIEHGEPARRHERFLQAWVAREAVCKAIGTGMTFPLHGDHFELAGGGTEGRLILGDGKADGAIRLVRFLPLDPEWVGAVAADGHDWNVVYCRVR